MLPSIPPPAPGLQRRALHFEAVSQRQLQGSLWQHPTTGAPAAAAPDPSELVCVHALDALFAAEATPGGPRRLAPRTLSRSDSSASGAGNGALSLRGSGGGAVLRFFTTGRRAVNLEVIQRQLGPPAEVAEAVQSLDCARLPVRGWAVGVSETASQAAALTGQDCVCSAGTRARRRASLLCTPLQVPVARELLANLPPDAELAALHAYLDAGGAVAALAPAEQLFAALRGAGRLGAKLQVRAAECSARSMRACTHLTCCVHTPMRACTPTHLLPSCPPSHPPPRC